MQVATTITFGAGETSTNTETDNILSVGISAGVSTKTATGGDTVDITETPSHYAECVFAVIPAAGGTVNQSIPAMRVPNVFIV
jgi:hypothetical protein